MAETIDIGGVKVTIDVDTSALDKSKTKTKKWGDEQDAQMDSITSSIANKWKSVALAVGVAVTAIIVTVKRMTEAMVDAKNAAEGLGLSVEAFTRLQYAATATGVGVEALNASLTALSRRMGERDQLSEGVRLFDALKVNVRAASGELKGADQVFFEVADRFAKMKDGMAKTELAMRLFGDGGVKLIPILNKGSAGLREMGLESDRLGNTLSKEAAAKAAELGETIARLEASFQSWLKSGVQEAVPALQILAGVLEDNSKKVRDLDRSWNILSGTIKIIVGTVDSVIKKFQAVAAYTVGWFEVMKLAGSGDITGAWKRLGQTLIETGKPLAELDRNSAVIWSNWVTTSTKAAAAFETKVKPPIVKSAEEIQKALEAIKLANQYTFEDLMNSDTAPYAKKIASLEQMVRKGTVTWREFDAAVRQLNESAGANVLKEIMATETQPFADKLRELEQLWVSGAIKAQDYHDAVRAVADTQKMAMSDLASTTSQALTTIFAESKSAAIASAIINTLQGVTKALSAYPPPYSFAMAGLQAAMGFAQVQKIQSTNKNSGSASAGSAVAPPVAAGAGGGVAPDRTLMVKGVNPRDMFSGSTMRDIARSILDFQRDGGKVVLV